MVQSYLKGDCASQYWFWNLESTALQNRVTVGHVELAE